MQIFYCSTNFQWAAAQAVIQVWIEGTILHCVSKKRHSFYCYNDFIRCRPIFIILLLVDSVEWYPVGCGAPPLIRERRVGDRPTGGVAPPLLVPPLALPLVARPLVAPPLALPFVAPPVYKERQFCMRESIYSSVCRGYMQFIVVIKSSYIRFVGVSDNEHFGLGTRLPARAVGTNHGLYNGAQRGAA